MPSPISVLPLDQGDDNLIEGDWPDRVVVAVNRPELQAFTIERPKAQALIFAGGGYVKLMLDTEGSDIAAWLNKLGYDAHLLVHRLPGAGSPPNPKDIALNDAMRAIEALKASDLPLILVGLSSGGHLAGVVACQAGTDARALVIAYAPLNANHRDYKAPAGKPDFPPAEKQAFYNDWPIGIATEPHGVPTCPVFLAYALHDAAVPVEHALNIIRTARDLNLDLDAHIFGQAPHGFALRDTNGSHASWPDLAADWLNRKLSVPASRHQPE